MNSFIIDKTGKRIACHFGMTHDILISHEYGCSIKKFLKGGGIRVMVRPEVMAVEFRSINQEQVKVLTKALKEQDIFCIVTDDGNKHNRIERFRPIRSLHSSWFNI
jgi:hypothetical protein